MVERESSEKMPTILMVYHLDGGAVMLTHYCMTGNQPRMRASAFNPGTGELKFDFLDATNMPSANAVHMHEVTMHLVDNQHLSTDWDLYENGRSKSVESFQYSRVR